VSLQKYTPDDTRVPESDRPSQVNLVAPASKRPENTVQTFLPKTSNISSATGVFMPA
jgi:hypothetical protein